MKFSLMMQRNQRACMHHQHFEPPSGISSSRFHHTSALTEIADAPASIVKEKGSFQKKKDFSSRSREQVNRVPVIQNIFMARISITGH